MGKTKKERKKESCESKESIKVNLPLHWKSRAGKNKW